MNRRRFLGALGATASVDLLGCGRPRDDVASLWFSYGGKNREVLLSLVDAFHRSQSRYRVEPVYQGDYFEGLAKLRTAMHVGAAPAVTHVVGEVIPYLVDAGVLDRLDAYPQLAKDDVVPSLSQAGCFIGGDARPLYALPFNRSTPISYFNREILDELSLAPPTTWEQMRAFARAARRTEGGTVTRWGFECPIDWWFWVALVGQAGGDVVAPDGEVTLGGEAGVEALALWQSLVHDDKTMRPPPGRDYNSWQVVNTDFLARRAAMTWTSTAFVRYLEDNASFPVVAAPLPAHRRRAVPTGGTFFVVPRQGPPESRAAAVAFLAFMMEPAHANAFATQTGYIPVSREGLRVLERDGYYAEHQNDRVALDQLADAMPWPWASELFRIQREIVQPRLEQAVLERRPPAETLAEAREAAKNP